MLTSSSLPNPRLIAHKLPTGTVLHYCFVLFCTVLYCTVLYSSVLYCTLLYCTVLVMYCNGGRAACFIEHEAISQYNNALYCTPQSAFKQPHASPQRAHPCYRS